MPTTPLNGMRVLDLTHHIAGPYCTKLFAELGADVIKIENPAGDGARRLQPFTGGKPHPEKSAIFLYLNTNKRSVVLNLHTSHDINQFKNLARNADILVENFRPGVMESLGIGYGVLERLNPRLVMTSISNFGQSGPYRDWQATEVTLNALSGMMYMTGQPDREPVKLGLNQVEYTAGITAAIATLAAHRYCLKTGYGQHVDVSLIEAMLNTVHQQFSRYGYWGAVAHRSWFAELPWFFKTKDGWIFASTGASFEVFTDFCGMNELKDSRFNNPTERLKHGEEYRKIVEPWFAQWNTLELCESAQLLGMVWAPVNNEASLLSCPQLNNRRFFIEINHPVAGQASYPGRYFVSEQIESSPPQPAPLFGEHTDEVLGNGWKAPQRNVTPSSNTNRPAYYASEMPLTGVRILTPEHWAALPHATKYLASLGAEVITIESPNRSSRDASSKSVIDSGGLFIEGSRNKLAISLDLGKPEGIEVFKRIVKISDVVADNFSPRVMSNLGLDYEALKQVKTDIIVLSISGFGHKGPRFLWRGHTVTAETTCGLANLTGYIGGLPVRPGGTPFGDIITAYHAAWSILIALENRDRTGKGAFLDLGMVEPCVRQLGEAIVHYSATEKALPRMGNRDLNAAPSGCYRCQGNDNWVAISITTDEQWQALVKVMGSPSWANSDRFKTMERRTLNHDQLDVYIGKWTVDYDKKHVSQICQSAGIPACAVLNVREVMIDSHLRDREAFEVIQVGSPPEGVGNRLHLAPPWKLSKTPASTLRLAPLQHGRDNDYVYQRLLSMTEAELVSLKEKGIINTVTSAKGPPARRSAIKSPEQFPVIDKNVSEILGLTL